MPTRRLPNTHATRDSALTTCKEKMDATDPGDLPFAAAKGTQLTAYQPTYHGLINAMNIALANQTNQTAVVKPLKRIAGFWVSHGFQALINACIREQFPNSVKNFYGIALESNKGPKLVSDSDITQAAITYNDGETARTTAGGDPITFPALADINSQVDAFKAAIQTQSTLKMAYDSAQETLAAADPDADLLILQLWNSIEATYDTGDKPSMRRKAREWGVVYVPSPGETPSGDDYSAIGTVKSATTGLPLSGVEVKISNSSITETYITEDDGKFYLPTVPTGDYQFDVMLLGYTPFSTPVHLTEGEIQEGDIDLTPETPEEP